MTQQPSWTALQKTAPDKKGILLMNRIGPSNSSLYIANADGSQERPLFAETQNIQLDYHASFSNCGEYVSFTSERNGDGQADIYRCKTDGSELEAVRGTPSVEDALTMSPDGKFGAYVSTEDGFTANIWVINFETGERSNVTGRPELAGAANSPDSYFRPTWSPDGQWIVFSSDRNTGWYGHHDGHGWEHTQDLGVYVIRPNGTDLRQIIQKDEMVYGSPKFSPNGKRIVFYETDRETTWGSRRPNFINRISSKIVSVDVETGADRIVHADGPGLKLGPQFMANNIDVAYYMKGSEDTAGTRATDAAWMQGDGPKAGVYYTSGADPVLRMLRSPCWSTDGTKMIYEKVDFTFRKQGIALYSWDPEWEYRSTDIFPVLSKQGVLAITEKQNGNSSIVTMRPDGSDYKIVFDVRGKGLDPLQNKKGLAGAFQPSWSPDGEWITFGLGPWFDARAGATSRVMRVKSDGSFFEDLTDGTEHVGFPSYSADGRFVVYRVWIEGSWGLRIVDVEDKSVRVLTTEMDNLPSWSPDGEWIAFTRQYGKCDYNICVIRPDGTGFKRLTDFIGNDAHSVWTYDNRLAYSTGMFGFRDECAIYDFTFQPYGQIMVMDKDGSNKKLVTDSLWEDSMPCYIPNKFL